MPAIRNVLRQSNKENIPPPPSCPTELLLPNQVFVQTAPTRQQYSATLLHNGLLPLILDSPQNHFHHSVYSLNVIHDLLVDMQDYMDLHRGTHRRFNYSYIQRLILRLNQVVVGQLANEFNEFQFERLLAYNVQNGRLEEPPRFVEPQPMPPPSPLTIPPPAFPESYHDQPNMPIFDQSLRNLFDAQDKPSEPPQPPQQPQQPPTPESPPYVVYTPHPSEFSPTVYQPRPLQPVDWDSISAALPSDFNFPKA